MTKHGSDMLTEKDVFNRFDDIFHIKDGERVKAGTPLDSLRSHRMAYITCD